MLPGQTRSAGFTVNSIVDAVDANPGDAACATAAGECTLRAAIQETNALPGPNTITLPAGTYVIRTDLGFREDAAASGDFDITDALEIIGAGAADALIDGGRFIHFGIHESTIEVRAATAVFSDLTIMNSGHPLGLGGGILNDGGTLTLNDVIVSGNVANRGAGIANFGALAVNGGAFEDNLGVLGLSVGGAIYNAGTLTANNVAVRHNTSGIGGGGIDNLGVAALTDVTVADNESTGGGGGIFNGGIIDLTGSTIFGNAPEGIFNDGALTATNSTVSSNINGIHNRGTATITNVAIIRNTAAVLGFGNGIYNDVGAPGSALTLRNTIISGNGGVDCGGPTPLVSQGHNLDSDGTCALNGPGDLQNTDPLLGPLADNGGPTLTHALLSGSPAIDGGDNEGCPERDQRGFLRPFDGDGAGQAVCDIGAYESHHCAGDVTADGIVDSLDVRLVARSMHSQPGSRRWNQAADVNGDGRVDPNDLHIVLRARRSGGCSA